MSRALVLVVCLAGCLRVGPVKLSLLPMAQSSSRDPDQTRNFVAEPAAPNGEGGVAAAGTDPLSKGPVSGGVTLASFALWSLAGLPSLLGMYGTFDETGLVELDPEQREEDAKRASLRTQAAHEAADEPVGSAGSAHEEQ